MPSLLSNDCSKAKKGFTLIELLIVIAIMLVLVGLAIPAVRTLTKSDTVREAAREVNLFIESARSDAVINGYSGIWLERDSSGNKVTKIFKVKRPPKYSGDFQGVTCYVEPIATPPTNVFDTTRFNLYFAESENSMLAQTASGRVPIQINDRVQLGGSGPWYQIISVPVADTHPTRTDGTGNPLPAFRLTVALNTFTYDSSSNRAGTFSANNYLVPIDGEIEFQIERSPKISTRDSLELPKGTFVDLAHSGFTVDPNEDQTLLVPGETLGGNEFASNSNFTAKVAPVLIMFRKDGSIDRVDYEIYPHDRPSPVDPNPLLTSQFARSNIFLLVATEPEDLEPNHNSLEDLDNLWIMISRTNGTVVTADIRSSNGAATPGAARAASRREAREGQNLTAN